MLDAADGRDMSREADGSLAAPAYKPRLPCCPFRNCAFRVCKGGVILEDLGPVNASYSLW